MSARRCQRGIERRAWSMDRGSQSMDHGSRSTIHDPLPRSTILLCTLPLIAGLLLVGLMGIVEAATKFIEPGRMRRLKTDYYRPRMNERSWSLATSLRSAE